MKKIMFMINSLYGGGAEKVLQTLLRNLNYDKYDVTLYSMHREELKSDCFPSRLHYKVIFDSYNGNSKLCAKLYRIYVKIKGKIFLYCSSSTFYRIFIHERYDVEIAFIEGESTKIVAGSSNKKSKKIAWVHVDLQANPWTDFLYKNIEDESIHYRRFDKIVCVSEAVKKAFVEKYEMIEDLR